MSDLTSTRERVMNRLRYLWTFELFDSVFVPGILALGLWFTDRPIGPLFWGGAALCTWLLWQGAAFWYLKLRAIRSGAAINARWLRRYAALKMANWALLALAPLALLAAGLMGAAPSLRLDGVVGVGLYLLALAEQVNYYYYQLMYDNGSDLAYLRQHRKLKRGAIARELAGRSV